MRKYFSITDSNQIIINIYLVSFELIMLIHILTPITRVLSYHKNTHEFFANMIQLNFSVMRKKHSFHSLFLTVLNNVYLIFIYLL